MSQVKAAQYIRMSTDRQDLSPGIQKQAIASYAAAHDLKLVASYEDCGKSGLTLNGRAGMRRLLTDVTSRRCGFTCVLVYDVSRWGRFQNTDASAYYDYHCRLHGVEVVYVAEDFSSDTSPLGAVIKNLKRAMAAEYSRELGVKTRAGVVRTIELGNQVGGVPCIGVDRLAVGLDSTPKRILEPGERKPSPTDRVRWTRGSDEDVALIRRIFVLYVETDMTVRGIARLLNTEKQQNRHRRPFTDQMVRHLLFSEIALGHYSWGRTMANAGHRVAAPPARHQRREGVLAPLVSRAMWEQARAKRSLYGRATRDGATMLRELQEAFARNPGLTNAELTAHGCATRSAYMREFGSMARAYELAGLSREAAQAVGRARSVVSANLHAALLDFLTQRLKSYDPLRSGYAKNLHLGEFIVGVRVLWPGATLQRIGWKLYVHPSEPCTHMVLVRMKNAIKVQDYLFGSLPDIRALPNWLSERSKASFQPMLVTSRSALGERVAGLLRR